MLLSAMLETNNILHTKNSLSKLQTQYEQLNHLCKTLDPYQSLNEAQKNLLASFDIRCWENPFQLTNEILQALMNLEEQINHE